MKEIPLTQGKVALVDDEDYERVSQYKWCYHKGTNKASRAVMFYGKQTLIYLPSILYHLEKDKKGIRFIDGNRLNYTKKNVEIVSLNVLHQGKNHKINNCCSSGFVGVIWAKKEKKWRAQISYCKKKYSAGSYDKELEAAAAYNKKAIELYGENAKLNPLPLDGG